MEYKLLVETAVFAGEIMLSSGAETYRTEDTILRMLQVSGLATTEALVTSTGILVTLSDPSITTISYVKGIEDRSTNLGKVHLVNNVSRNFCSGKITLKEAYEELLRIKEKTFYSNRAHFFGNVGTVMFFTLLLGGSGMDFVFATLNGFFVALCIYGAHRIQLNTFIMNTLTAGFVAIVTMLISRNSPISLQEDLIISGAIMPLLPGVAITNAIRDTLQGDYMSGSARALEAFVLATSIAVGIGAGLSFFGALSNGVFIS